MRRNRHSIDQAQDRGAALVVTLIVLVVLAAVAVAFLQNTGLDRAGSRSAANVYRAQLAAEAGLAEAIFLIQQNANNFAYLTGAEPSGAGYRTFIRKLDGTSGTWQFGSGPVFLDSGAAADDGARVVLTGTAPEPKIQQQAAWKNLPGPVPGAAGPTARYAFWVDEANAKQNLAWWGGGSAPAEGSSPTNLAQLTPFLPDESGKDSERLPDGLMKAIADQRALSLTNFSLDDVDFDSVRSDFAPPTVATVNLLNSAFDGRINNYFFSLSSASGATTPKGTPKLNLAALARHVSTLNSDQGADSAKAKLVADLLKEEPEQAESWGGGSLSWLAASGKYSDAEQKQIVANIIDYLDEDLFPTTDSTDSPTYLGVEFKLDEDGAVRGHPLVNMVGFGSVFNWKNKKLMSTFLLAFMGWCNPWSAAISAADYTPEITVAMEGTVQNGTLGDSVDQYFGLTLDTLPDPEVTELEPKTGATYPGPPSRNDEYRSIYSLPEPQPETLVFNNIVYKIVTLRLRFKDTDGREGIVQTLPKDLSVTMAPDIVTPKSSGSSVFKLTRAPSANQQDLHLQGDPRLNFKDSVWVNSKSSGGKNREIPTPQTPVDMTLNTGPDWDGAQGLPTGSTWYQSASVTNHFNRGSESGMSSIGELGYIWAGKPWQTLNLHKTDKPATADWNLLDYVTAGRLAAKDGSDADDDGGTAVPTLPTASLSGAEAPINGGLVALGGFNVNSRKLPTIQAVLAGAPGIDEGAAEDLVAEASASQASAYGEIAALASAVPAITGDSDNDFQLEGAQRALGNIAVNHSRLFTVYAVGESKQGNSASRAQLEADIFVGVDPATKKPTVQIISQRFL